MDKEIKELNEVTGTTEGETPVGGVGSAPDAEERIAELTARLTEVTIRLELLMAGADKERLDEGARLAAGLCGAGMAPADAAAEVVAEYPHIRAVQREIPQLSVQGGGRDDGFAAIRSIFAKK